MVGTQVARTHARTHGSCVFLGVLLAIVLCGCAASDARSAGEEMSSSTELPISGSNAQIDNTGFSNPWMPAVGQLQLATGSSTTRCTGTLIAPGVVLTAGHCLNGVPAQNAGQFVIPTAAPVGNAPSGPQFPIQSWKRLTGAAPDAHDVACVFLTTPVPKPVVASYPRVYTGGVKSVRQGDAQASGLHRRKPNGSGSRATLPHGSRERDLYEASPGPLPRRREEVRGDCRHARRPLGSRLEHQQDAHGVASRWSRPDRAVQRRVHGQGFG